MLKVILWFPLPQCTGVNDIGLGNLLLTGWEECLENQQNSAGKAQCVATLMNDMLDA